MTSHDAAAETHPTTTAGTVAAHCIVRNAEVATDAVPLNVIELRNRIGQRPETLPEGLFEECMEQLRGVLAYRYCYTRVPVLRPEEGALDLGFGVLHSASLNRNLAGCEEAILFAATIGSGADRLLHRLSLTSPTKRFLVDAMASTAAESLADYVNRTLAEGLVTAPRFSPGFGGVPLSVQPAFLHCLDASRQIGITLSETNYMNPTKSVTALIGIRESRRNL